MTDDAIVEIDLRKGEYVVQSSSTCQAGYWISNGYFERLPVASTTDTELGDAVLRARAKSEKGVPNPPSGQPLPAFTKLMDEVGAKSYSQYIKGTKHIDLAFNSDAIRVAAYRNAGARDGFKVIKGSEEDLQAPSAEVLGRAARAAFEPAE